MDTCVCVSVLQVLVLHTKLIMDGELVLTKLN